MRPSPTRDWSGSAQRPPTAGSAQLPRRPGGGPVLVTSCRWHLLLLPWVSPVSSWALANRIPELLPHYLPLSQLHSAPSPLGSHATLLSAPPLSLAASPASALPPSPWTLSLPHRRPVTAPTGRACKPSHGPCVLAAVRSRRLLTDPSLVGPEGLGSSSPFPDPRAGIPQAPALPPSVCGRRPGRRRFSSCDGLQHGLWSQAAPGWHLLLLRFLTPH